MCQIQKENFVKSDVKKVPVFSLHGPNFCAIVFLQSFLKYFNIFEGELFRHE